MNTPASTPTTFKAGATYVQWNTPESASAKFEGGATYASVAKLARFGPCVSPTDDHGDGEGDVLTPTSTPTPSSMYPSVVMFAGCQLPSSVNLEGTKAKPSSEEGETFEEALAAYGPSYQPPDFKDGCALSPLCQPDDLLRASGAHLEQAADRVGTLEDKYRDEDTR